MFVDVVRSSCEKVSQTRVFSRDSSLGKTLDPCLTTQGISSTSATSVFGEKNATSIHTAVATTDYRAVTISMSKFGFFTEASTKSCKSDLRNVIDRLAD